MTKTAKSKNDPKLWSILGITKSAKGVILSEEEKECVKFANALRALSLEGKLKCIWFHPENEGKRSIVYGFKGKLMGRIPGTPDFVFLATDQSACFEFKSRTGAQSPSQKIFASWCQSLEVPYYIIRSQEDGLSALRELGLIID